MFVCVSLFRSMFLLILRMCNSNILNPINWAQISSKAANVGELPRGKCRLSTENDRQPSFLWATPLLGRRALLSGFSWLVTQHSSEGMYILVFHSGTRVRNLSVRNLEFSAISPLLSFVGIPHRYCPSCVIRYVGPSGIRESLSWGWWTVSARITQRIMKFKTERILSNSHGRCLAR